MLPSSPNTRITANSKNLLRKKLHINALMSDLYKETSPNSKILKSLLQPNELQKILLGKSLHVNRNPVRTKPQISGVISDVSEDIFGISKDFTIEPPEIDEIYSRNSAEIKKNEEGIKKIDEVLFETLQKKQLNPPSFAQGLRKKVRMFKSSHDLDNSHSLSSSIPGKEFIKRGSTRLIQNSLEASIRKRLEQKQSGRRLPKFSKSVDKKFEFLEMYRGIEQRHKNIEQKGNESELRPFDRSGMRSEASLAKREPSANKQLELFEQRKAFERVLQSAKGRLIEKINKVSDKSKKRAKTLNESLTVIDKIKRKYEFFSKPKQRDEPIFDSSPNILPAPKILLDERISSASKPRVRGQTFYTLTFNEKVRNYLSKNPPSRPELPEPRKSLYEPAPQFRRECDDLLKLKVERSSSHSENTELDFTTYQTFKKLCPQVKKSKGLLKEMRVGFQEIERRLRGFKQQLSEVPESLHINLKD